MRKEEGKERERKDFRKLKKKRRGKKKEKNQRKGKKTAEKDYLTCNSSFKQYHV
jgi:hypothetical protein